MIIQKAMKFYKFLLIIALFCSNAVNAQVQYQIKTQKCVRGLYEGNSAVSSYQYSIRNKTRQNLLIFFVEEEKDTIPCVKLLKRKLLRRYGDFSLSWIEWEDMVIEKSDNVRPELFVKVLAPKEKFKIIIPFADYEEEQLASKIAQHLLVCPESMFSDNQIGMPYFVENLQRYKFAYPGKSIVFSAGTLKSSCK